MKTLMFSTLFSIIVGPAVARNIASIHPESARYKTCSAQSWNDERNYHVTIYGEDELGSKELFLSRADGEKDTATAIQEVNAEIADAEARLVKDGTCGQIGEPTAVHITF